MKQEMMGWEWHQLDATQIICASLQTANCTSTSSLNFLTPNQQRKSTEDNISQQLNSMSDAQHAWYVVCVVVICRHW